MRTGGNLVAGGALALVSAGVGFFLGRSSVEPREVASAPAGDAGPDLGPVLDELRALRSELRIAPVARAPAPETAAAAPEAIPADRIAKLQETLDQIAKRQDEAEHHEGRGSGFADLAAIGRKLQLLESGFESIEVVRSEILTAHARWNRADLRTRYGAPGSEAPDGQKWRCTYEAGNSWVEFKLADDEVVDVLITRKQP